MSHGRRHGNHLRPWIPRDRERQKEKREGKGVKGFGGNQGEGMAVKIQN